MEKQLKDIVKEIRELAKGQDTISAKMDTHYDDLKKSLAEEIASCNRKTERVKLKVNLLESKVDLHLDTERRLCNLILNGIPFKEGENLSKIFASISSLIGFKVPPEARYFRFKPNANNNNRPILIKFPTEYHKEDFMQNYIKAADQMLLNAISGFSKSKNDRIFLQHDLSPSQYKVNKSAIKLRKSGGVQAIRIIHGNVGVKFGDEDKFSFFNSAGDLETQAANSKKAN